MSPKFGILSVFDHHIARIKRIVEEEFSGCSVVFDQNAWPFIRFHIQDSQGAMRSQSYPRYSIAELEKLSDEKLRSAIRRLFSS